MARTFKEYVSDFGSAMKAEMKGKDAKKAVSDNQAKRFQDSLTKGGPKGSRAVPKVTKPSQEPSKIDRTEEVVVTATRPAKKPQTASSGQKKAPKTEKPMSDADILAWNNKRKAARGEKQLDKSVLDKASYKSGTKMAKGGLVKPGSKCR